MLKVKLLLPSIIMSIFLITGWAYSDTIIVNNLGNSGDGSLRWAMEKANTNAGSDTIRFNVYGTISPTSFLPAITDNETVIDASSQWAGEWPEGKPGITLDGGKDVDGLLIDGADKCHIRGLYITNFVESGVSISGAGKFNTIGGTGIGYRNVISGNDGYGVVINAADSNVVSGNYIGTDVNGTTAMINLYRGVVIAEGAQSNTIGGTSAGERNIISGNGFMGVDIHGSGTNSNVVSGNYIGMDVNGTAAMGNISYGVSISEGARSNTIGGTGNTIAFNGDNGVVVDGINTDYNKISKNSIHDNAGLGIDLVDDGNDEIPVPTITSAVLTENMLKVEGTIAGADAMVEIFETDSFASGEGMTYLGSLTADGSGDFSGDIDVTEKELAAGDLITSTTTHTDNNTSEFSLPTDIAVAEVCECDLTNDGKCDMQDWLLFGEDWGHTDCNEPNVDCECDLNTDGKCDMQDWLLFGEDWGRTDCP